MREGTKSKLYIRFVTWAVKWMEFAVSEMGKDFGSCEVGGWKLRALNFGHIKFAVLMRYIHVETRRGQLEKQVEVQERDPGLDILSTIDSTC